MPTIEELRASMRGAAPAGRGVYFEPGLHFVKAKLVKYNRTLIEGTAKETFVGEFEIIQSTFFKPGLTCSAIHAKKNKGWLGRLKAMIAACMGYDPQGKLSNEAEDEIATAYAALEHDEYRKQSGYPENFLAGSADMPVYLRVEGSAGKSLAGTPITNLKWEPWDGTTYPPGVAFVSAAA